MSGMKKWISVIVTIVFLLSLSGCTAIGIDVESQMRPPKNNGEQERLQHALDLYAAQHDVPQYSLKYPGGGNYLSAFILLRDLLSPTYVSASTEDVNLQYEGVENFCIAFYQPDIDGANTHIHLLQNMDGAWVSVADVEGRGNTLAQVDFADLDGDAFPELLIGWNLYNTKDRILYVYSIKNMLEAISTTEIYTSMVVSDLTADGADDLLLTTIDPITDLLSAHLLSYQSQKLSVVGQTEVDGDVLSVDRAINTVFGDGTRGVFLDVYKEPNTTVTELLLWKNGFLWSPLGRRGVLTARPFTLNCCDIDEDGSVEWPAIAFVDNNATSVMNACWKTQWYSYDVTNNKILFDFDSVVKTNDGYVLKLTEVFSEDFSITYDKEKHIMEFVAIDENGNEESFLKIQTTTSNKKTDLQEGFTVFDSSDSLFFSIWYDNEFPVTVEEIQYLFSVI